MNNHAFMPPISMTLSLLSAMIIVFILGIGRYTPWLIPLWLCSIGLLVIAAYGQSKARWTPVILTPRSLGILLLILLPLVVRVLNYQPNRIHGDDLLTASFSLGFHPRTANFFAGVPEGLEWVAKFPAPYFLFQKLFLYFFGASVLTVKLSVLPYVLIVSIMTYLTASMILGPVSAVAAVILYAFMAISIYHETLGLHFISATAVFMIFFYSLLRAAKSTRPFWYTVSGVTAALCYLTYTSSYIALPILIAALLWHVITKKSRMGAIGIAWALIGFLITIAPFLTYAVRTENYFATRINQVSLLTGSWSKDRLNNTNKAAPSGAITKNLQVSFRALIQDGIGGHGGYTFNRRAFFNRPGMLLFVIGIVISLMLMWRHHAIALILLIIMLSYITGVVLTIPPPAYHRLSLAFPFIAIISAVPFHYLFRLVPRRSMIAALGVILAIYAGTNIQYVQSAVKNEALIPDAAVIQFINTTYPNRHIHIAAFPYFALERLYPFFTPRTALSIDTRYHIHYLDHFQPDEPYLYIITLPTEFKDTFIKADTNGTYIPFSEKYGIFTNEEVQ